MTAHGNLRTGGQLLVDALRTHQVDAAFCVPGESYLAALDALHDAPEIRLIVCRQEGGAAMMADAYGKLTGRPGVCFVTRGPGATNASSGVHVAFQDSTPMVLFVGQVARHMTEREAFQEIDFRRMFGQLAKWVAQIDDPARVPEMVSRAFQTATSGRPGPVVLALPEDMQTEPAPGADIHSYSPVVAHPGAADMQALREQLAAVERPLMIVGGGGWTAQACAQVQAFAEASGLPTGVSFRCQDYIDNDSPIYAGHIGVGIDPKLAKRVREADLILAVGVRLGEATTSGYTLLQVPRPTQRLVHVHASAEELGRVYQADLAINAGMVPFAAALADLQPVDGGKWRDWLQAARADYEAFGEPLPGPGPLQMSEVAASLRRLLPPETIVSNGAGNYATWVHRYHKYRRYRTQLAPTSGSMGYGLPAAIAAKVVHPDRPAVCFAGDGCFMMTGQELATAVQYGLGVLILVVNNGMYGTIRMHQERSYPGRVHGTALANPDFAALARAYGAFGEAVSRTEDFEPALQRALASGGPALLELRVDPEALTPSASLTQIREAALAKA